MTTTEVPKENQVFNPTIESLMNKGVEISVFAVKHVSVNDPDTQEVTMVWEAQPTKRFQLVKFTNRVVAALEKKFGNTAAWNNALGLQPYNTVLETLCIAWSYPADRVSEMMDVSAIEEYQLAMLMAWMLSLGASADDVSKLLTPALQLGRAKDMLVAEIVKQGMEGAAYLAYPGTLGSENGSVSEEPSKNSGEVDPPKQSSSSKPTSDQVKPPKAKGK